MAPDPAPPPVVLAIPALSLPPNLSSLSPNSDPRTSSSDLSSSRSDPACPSPVLAPPPPAFSASSPESPAPVQAPVLAPSPPVLPVLAPPPFSDASPTLLQPPSAAATPVLPLNPSALQRQASSLHAHPPPGYAHDGTPSVRSNAPATAISSAAPCLASAVPPPLLQPSPGGHPSIEVAPAMPNGAPTAPLLARPAAGSLPAVLQQCPPSVRRNAQTNSLAAAQVHPSLLGSTPSPPLRSYAQVASGTRGSGFVSSHAHDIEAFARLPRTGINVISGSREGLHSFGFVPSEFPKIAAVYANALVMKFLGGRPSLEQSHKAISSWGIENPFSIGPLSSRAFLLRFQNENDLLKVLSRPSQTLITFPYKIFRWHTQCDIKEDSCMAPVWVSLPNIQLHCFLPEFLEAVANRIGRFLCLDKATATLARPSSARMCVEIDLRKPPPQFIWVDLFDGFKQPVVYDKLPKFCTQCHLRGHSTVHCSKVTLDTPQSQLAGRPAAVQNGTPPVRRNAKLGAVPPQPSSVAAPAAPLLASDTSQQDPPDPSQQQRHPPPISPVVPSSEQQHTAAEPYVPSPLLQSPTQQAPPAAAPHLPAPHLQSSFDVATQQPLPPLPSNAKAFSSPCPAAAVHPIAQDPCPAAAVPLIATDPHMHPSVLPLQQSGISRELHPPRPLSSSSAKASPSASSFPAAAVSPSTADPPLIPTPSNVEAISSSAPLPSAAVSPVDSVQHPPSSEVQPSDTNSVSAPAAVPSPAQFLSAQAAPFSPSDPVQSVQQASSLNNQHSTSSLSFFYNKHGAKCMTMPSRPWEMVNRQQGSQGHLSSIINAPSPSYNLHQIHALEGYDSEGSFETDSQPNSPLESPKEDANKCPFLPQSCASEGEQPTEDHPGFQGHISDVEFYHRPMSSKKNKRQPDGPLRVQLRTRKGLSVHK